MHLALSQQIGDIDRFAEQSLGIPTAELMARSGRAVERAVRERLESGKSIVILAGKGNNGADGYAAATFLFADYRITVVDVFAMGQRSECGKHFLSAYRDLGGSIIEYSEDDELERLISGSDCIIDAIFGTGFVGEAPERIKRLSRIINETVRALKIAIDVPIGINADTGAVNTTLACTMNATVVLSFIKPGLVSYPAKPYVGEILFDDLALPQELLSERFEFNYTLVDEKCARAMMPKREENSSKGSFGKLLIITGSRKFPGAGALSLEAALRGGVGYVTHMGEERLVASLCMKFPEAIYKTIPEMEKISDDDISAIVEASARASATLIGSGSGCSDGLLKLVNALLLAEGGPLILDADAINVLAEKREESLALIRNSVRTVILTPHPLEFSRLCANNVSDIQLHRIEAAKKFAAEQRCILVLKGAGTITTDGKQVLINSSGSSALAKAGSGDVLAGFLSAMIAQGGDPLAMSALSVFYHAYAADTLAREYSLFGVTPSDLPRQIAKSLT